MLLGLKLEPALTRVLMSSADCWLFGFLCLGCNALDISWQRAIFPITNNSLLIQNCPSEYIKLKSIPTIKSYWSIFTMFMHKKKMQHKISAIGVFKRHFCSESLQSPGINKLSSLNLFVVVYHYWDTRNFYSNLIKNFLPILSGTVADRPAYRSL